MSYATHTTVSIDRSRAEIQALLNRYGCQGFAYQQIASKATVSFFTHDRVVRFVLNLPAVEEFETYPSGRGVRRCSPSQMQSRWEQACKSRWRALCLAIKAKLEAVESGISLFEDEFLAYIVDPSSNETVGDILKPQLKERYLNSKTTTQLLLPGPSPLSRKKS